MNQRQRKLLQTTARRRSPPATTRRLRLPSRAAAVPRAKAGPAALGAVQRVSARKTAAHAATIAQPRLCEKPTTKLQVREVMPRSSNGTALGSVPHGVPLRPAIRLGRRGDGRCTRGFPAMPCGAKRTDTNVVYLRASAEPCLDSSTIVVCRRAARRVRRHEAALRRTTEKKAQWLHR